MNDELTDALLRLLDEAAKTCGRNNCNCPGAGRVKAAAERAEIEPTITPLTIEIMLWYYSRATEYGERDANFNAPAVQDTIQFLKDSGMLENSVSATPVYRITEKGRCWIDALTSVQFPGRHWEVKMGEW